MPTVAELEQELARAREEEERKQQEQERAIAVAKRQEELSLTDGYMVELQKQMTERGVETTVKNGRDSRYASLQFPADSDGFKAMADPHVERRGGTYYSSHSYQIQFGGYGERKTYPRLKNGGFNYAKIADELVAFIKSSVARRIRSESESANYNASKKIVERLDAEFQVLGATVYANSSDASKVRLKIDTLFSEDKARTVLAAIDAAKKAS